MRSGMKFNAAVQPPLPKGRTKKGSSNVPVSFLLGFETIEACHTTGDWLVVVFLRCLCFQSV